MRSSARRRTLPGSKGASTSGDVGWRSAGVGGGEAGGVLREAGTWTTNLSGGLAGEQVEAEGGLKPSCARPHFSNEGRSRFSRRKRSAALRTPKCSSRVHRSARHFPRSYQTCPEIWWRKSTARGQNGGVGHLSSTDGNTHQLGNPTAGVGIFVRTFIGRRWSAPATRRRS